MPEDKRIELIQRITNFIEQRADGDESVEYLKGWNDFRYALEKELKNIKQELEEVMTLNKILKKLHMGEINIEEAKSFIRELLMHKLSYNTAKIEEIMNG